MWVNFPLFIWNVFSDFVDSEVQFILVECKDKIKLYTVVHGDVVVANDLVGTTDAREWRYPLNE